MTFEEILGQVIEALQREQRISYRALKRRFALDDAYLDDVKEELIYAKQLARDEDNRFLIWTGEVTPLPPAAPATLLAFAPLAYTPKHLTEKILADRPALEGERKQVTVLFADLKGSTEIIQGLDPEAAQQLLDPAIQRMRDAVHRFEGTVNQVLGDGIMALFGAPIAHEDHALRACYAALAMQAAMRAYTAEVRQRQGLELHRRVGLNSGEVVVRAIGNDLHMDYSAVGETTHLAARMEQLATPGTIRLTAATLRLVEGLVQVNALGGVPVKGVTAPVEVFELVGASGMRRRLQAAAARGLTRFVGRQQELDMLHQALERAGAGHGQVVAVVGEAGVGKSRLVYECVHSHRTQGWQVLEAASVSYGKATAYFPVIDLLKRYVHLDDRDDTRTIRARLTGQVLTLDETLQETIPALLALLDALPDDSPFLTLDPPQRRQRTLDALKRILLRFTFKHALTYEVAYGSPLQERRRGLHARIVDVLEQLPAERRAEQIDRLAHHAVRGAVWDKALAYCRQAGARATARSAYREAVAYFEQALAALAQLPERPDTLEQAIDLRFDLRNALLPLGEHRRILDYLRAAEPLAERLGDPQRLGHIACYLCNVLSVIGEHDSALVAGQRALALATTSGAFDVQVVAQYHLGIAYITVGDFRQALDVSRRVMMSLTGELRYARFGQAALPAAISGAHIAWCLAELGGFAEGSGVGEEAVRTAEEAEHPYSIAIALMWVGMLSRRQGDLHRAIPMLERGLALCQIADFPEVFSTIAPLLGTAYALAGRIAEALPLLDQTLERLTTGSSMRFHALVLTELSEALLLVGRVDEANALAARLLELSHTHTGHGYQAHACRLLSGIAMHRDPPDVDQASAHYRQALALAENLGMRPLQAHCHLGLRTLYATVGQREQARPALTTAIEMYRTMEMTFWLPQAEAVLAQLGGC